MFLLRTPALPPGDAAPLIFSASDLVVASECEYRTLRILDEKLGRTGKPGFPQDAMLRRAAELGDAFEHKILRELTARYGTWHPASGAGVKVVERGALTWAGLEAKRKETLAALRGGADVVFQATFFDGSLVGFADFLVKQGDGSYAVWDTKLARHARVSALLQLAAYGDQLEKYGIPVDPVATLVLGDRSRSDHPMPDLLPVFRERRGNFLALTAGHRAQPNPVAWLQDGIAYCGRCDYCAEQVEKHRDLLLVNGMSGPQRRKLMAQGITGIDALAAMPRAAATGPLARLRDQARMQLGLDVADGTAFAGTDGHPVSYKVLRDSISRLPAPSAGDIFFDFEGDPLWQDAATEKWGIEYLFGSIEAPVPGAAPGTPEVFRPFWAHTRGQERQALIDFIAYVEARRAAHPDMHVYHYAPYEKAALRRLSVEHGVGEDAIDDWLRTGLLVDLLDTVRQSVRISEPSYSIKKLEPFYMPAGRVGEVTNAGASVVAYAEYCAARDAGRAGDTARAAEARETLASIGAYNEYDCLSTLRLRDWLLAIGAAVQVATWTEGSGKRDVPEAKESSYEPSPGEVRLRVFLDKLAAGRTAGQEPTDDETAIAMVAAAASYHRREDKQFWWGHFDRLEKPVDSWAEERNILIVRDAWVLEDWAKATPRARTETRTVKLRGTATEGSDFRPGTQWFGMFNAPLPGGMADGEADASRRGGLFNVTVVEDVSAPGTPELTTLIVTEKSTLKVPAYNQLPMALTPNQPVATKSIREALAALAATVGGTLPDLPRHPGLEILRKARPRLAGGGDLPSAAVPRDGHGLEQPDYVAAITEAVLALDHSYLAVQGPPGTGKTHVGSHVIANLVARGWKVGVVGQSHAVVENMLRAAVEKAGVDPDRVGKKLAAPHGVPWTVTDEKQFGRLLGDAGGALIGGTAWTMTGTNVPAGSLDLLVIDEAGQYSLANTLAVAQAAQRLLLLGDPQQLPQVTQGSHPVPVDDSALGWLSRDHATLPPELGYFLADSWRMHPRLCDAVSQLSYEGKLKSAPAAAERHLAGKPAGVETVLVVPAPGSSRDNRQSSPEEAAEVVAQAKGHLGLVWTPGADGVPRRLVQADILVVAAYNAQVHLVRGVLDAAGLAEVRVGTVDKFQGQEAPVVLVTMACADPAGAPRGMEFLLNRNRINVAVSRGQWRAVIIRSPQLTRFMPSRPAAMAELGAFIGLCNRG
ncbi:TM0106 family RecB-like putative nuclease [Arthrobacter sp. SDTb3-6]|uniref:TM0106 family RecB-like putative nuclease n=1 Tax=Arthrobacter sp. SDTb3-6 TaxID=2713571 RepID=UPI00159E2483|nr:TM0106 family RecB-like putative nuclease [Arthrobacter sp. SDTb3-6]NVM98279.1 TM0106 family RecB-like putative nuclease [Arthrobacter sp. SDTb3-6]